MNNMNSTMKTAEEKARKSCQECVPLTNRTAETVASDETFDPYDYCQADGISWWAGAVHIIRCSIGSGFLLMPYTMKKTGYITGTLLVLAVGFVYFHIIHILLATEYRVCKRLKIKSVSYIDLVDNIFQRSPFPVNKFRQFIRYLMYLFYGIPTGNATYLIVMANGIQMLAKFFDVNLKPTIIICFIIIPLTLLCMSRRILEILVPYSSVTNIFSLFMAAILVVTSTIYRKQYVNSYAFGDPSFIPDGVAICASAFRCTALVLPVKNNMRQPKKLSTTFGAINVAGSTITLFHYSFGVILYLNYGEDVRENVLLNMPVKNYVTDAINLLYTTTLFVSYILVFFGRFDNLWSGTLKQRFADTKHAFVLEYGIRIGLNALAFLLAVGVPNLAIISAFAGVMGIVLEVALPSVLELLSMYAEKKRNYWLVFKDVTIIGVSSVLFCMSLVSLVEQVTRLYSG